MRSVSLSVLSLLFFGLLGCTVSPGYRQEGSRWLFVSPRGIGDAPALFPVKGADFATFHQLVDPEYAADSNYAYYRGDRIKGALPGSFRHLSGVYWMDARRIYFEGVPIIGADPASFEVLRSPWARDAKSCFRGPYPIPDSDPSTFQPIDFLWARDKSHYYAYNHTNIVIVRCDYSSMRILGSGYAKDRNQVFWLGREVKGADAGTFEVIGASLGKDKFRRYGGAEEFWMDKKTREPNQPPQRNAGSRPSSVNSSVSETPSSLGPRG